MRRFLLGEWSARKWLIGLAYGVLLFVVAALAALAFSSSAGATVPAPVNRVFYCIVDGRKVQCWCDEWLHYPICRRWHW